VNRTDLLAFLRRHRLCCQASVSNSSAPQAAVVGYGVSDDLEVVFDTLATTRKMTNVPRDARIALVIGWDEEQTVQIEGVADEPTGAELGRLKLVYFAAYPDGPERETWARYSDFRPGGWGRRAGRGGASRDEADVRHPRHACRRDPVVR
jgi:hypothetical protein